MNLLTVKEAAKLLHLKPVTVYARIYSGQLTAYKQGDKILIKREDLENQLPLVKITTPQDRITAACDNIYLK